MARPDYLIIGAQRCGTTSLMRYLGHHPDVVFKARKELNFFDSRWHLGLAWYGKQLGKRRPGKLCGEKSPNYLIDPVVPGRVKSVVPNVKLLVLLRNPVDRAYSHYKLARHLKREKRPFAQAVMQPETGWRKVASGFRLRGHYAEQLERWFEHFPREQFHIIRSEDFFSDTGAEYGKALAFLRLKRWFPQFKRHGQAGKLPPMDTQTRRELVDYFKPYNEQLYELLQKDFKWEG